MALGHFKGFFNLPIASKATFILVFLERKKTSQAFLSEIFSNEIRYH
jgi:hypothetical protein